MPAGNWVMVEGIDLTITKTATITQLTGCEDVNLSSCVHTVVPCDRAVVSCDHAVVSCDHTMVSCDCAVVSCDRAVVSCDLAVVSCDRAVVSCDRAVVPCDRAVVSCDHTYLYSVCVRTPGAPYYCVILPVPPSLPGPDLPSPQVQHTVSNQDRSGTGEPLRTAQDAGRSEESQQVIPPPRYQGM